MSIGIQFHLQDLKIMFCHWLMHLIVTIISTQIHTNDSTFCDSDLILINTQCSLKNLVMLLKVYTQNELIYVCMYVKMTERHSADHY